jgi:arylsulfatase
VFSELERRNRFPSPDQREFLMILRSLFVAALIVGVLEPLWAAERSPNIVFIMADDLGSAELGCYGQKKIKTPSLDKLASEGIRFTQFYAGNAVCAPSRCVLMTGKHAGHAAVRNNKDVPHPDTPPIGQWPLPKDEVTIAELLKTKGYATAWAGKWGLGPLDSEGDPLKQGFDHYFGYLCQWHAHSHYPKFVYRDGKQVDLEGNDGKTGTQFTQDLFEAEALKFIKDNKEKPFFLYLPFTVPHVAVQVPEDSLKEYAGLFDDPPYKGDKGYQPHPTPRAAYAAMVTRMDRSVGRIVKLLDELKLGGDTLIMFTSDNGPAPQGVGGSDSKFFASAGDLRGLKGSLYEGGIRVPFIARWTGKIKAGSTSDLPLAFCDVLPTLSAVADVQTPANIDGLSFVPTLLGKGEQKKHDFLYWEFPGSGGQQAVRLGQWKGVRQDLLKGQLDVQLYNLSDDPSEKTNVAEKHPEIVKRLEKIMKEQHTPGKDFPLKALDELVQP